MRDISSYPGARIFRTAASIILVFILAGYFLVKMNDVTRQVEIVAIKKMVANMNTALSLVIYQTAVSGNLDKLNLLSNQNPFYYLAFSQGLPNDYQGVVINRSEIEQAGWYFTQEKNQVVYRSSDQEDFFFFLVFDYIDLNGTNRYEPDQDKINHLKIIKAPY